MARLEAIGKPSFERVDCGSLVDLVALDNESGHAERLCSAWPGCAVTLYSRWGSGLRADVGPGREPPAGRGGPQRPPTMLPRFHVSDPGQAVAAAAVAKKENCPPAVRA